MKLTLIKSSDRLSEDIGDSLGDAQRQFQIRNLKKMIRFMKAQLKRLEKEGTID